MTPYGYGQDVNAQSTWTPVQCGITIATLCTPVCGQDAGFGAAGGGYGGYGDYGGAGFGGQAAQMQATWTPVGCNITVATLCTPVCAQDWGGGAAATPQGGIAPQATFTPAPCGTIATPLCGGPIHTAICPTRIHCPPVTLPIHCPPLTLLIHCPPITRPPQCFPHTLLNCPPRTLVGCPVNTFICPPVTLNCPLPTLSCPFGGGVGGTPMQVGAQPQATWTPVQCGITVATLCTPVCGQGAAGVGMGMGQPPYAAGPAQPQATLGPIQCNITIFTICTPLCGQ